MTHGRGKGDSAAQQGGGTMTRELPESGAARVGVPREEEARHSSQTCFLVTGEKEMAFIRGENDKQMGGEGN